VGLLRACQQVDHWNRSRVGAPLRASVNLSSRQLNHRNLCHLIDRALCDSGLPPECLTLELTETGILFDEQAAVASMRELNAMGVRCFIDRPALVFGRRASALNLRPFGHARFRVPGAVCLSASGRMRP